MSGPICGAIFQPYFGSWSDQYQSRWGRRKPFIIVGTIIIIVSMLSLAWAEAITALIIGSATNGPYQTCLVILTMLFTFLMFVALQAVQVGLRAFVTDGCAPNKQVKVNAWVSFHSMLAATFGHLLAFLDLSLIQGFGHTVFMNMSLLGVIFLIITIAISCLSEKERYTTKVSIRKTRNMTPKAIWALFSTKSSQIRTICLVQFFAWLGWFPFLFYTVTYVCRFLSPFHFEKCKFTDIY
jgi:solute carrier family 45 protein 1/2/4